MKSILFITILIPLALQAQVRDDFSDGNFTSNPEWTGDTSAFTVNSQHQLQLNSSGSDTSCLVTQGFALASREWSFWIKMSFNTSLNNYARIYLGSDTRNLKGITNAVYMQAGGSGDSLVLFRQSGSVCLPMFKFPYLRTNHSVNVLRIRICRDSAGNWDLYADSTGGNSLVRYGSFSDKGVVPSAWLGVYCRYTSSNSGKFWFDDFYAGEILHDTIPPCLLSAGFSDSLTIRMKFSENIDSSYLYADSNFSLKNNPEKILKAHILKGDQSILFIQINTEQNGFFCDSLKIKKISDFSHNFLTDTCVFICYYIPGPCLPGDVLINEVLFNPDASGARFIEFYNCSNKGINLNSLSVGTTTGSEAAGQFEILSQTERMLLPGGFFVFTADSEKLCSRYRVPFPDRLLVPDHFPSMNQDSGSVVLITHGDSVVIDEMWYNDNMQLPFLENKDGVSLERLDPQLPSVLRANWQSASGTSGFASPGYENSHYAADPGKGIDIQLSSALISPDNDGKDDFLYIRLNKVEEGTLVTLRIFDIRGNLVRTLCSSGTASENSLFVWDGTGDNKLRVPIGYYILLSESLSISGRHSRVKKAIVVAEKL